ncbi:MAG: signal peptidase II [Nitrospirota bacterium]
MKKSILISLIVSSVIVLDQITKYLVNRYIDASDSVEIFPFLHIVNVRNTGAAFGILKDLNSGFFILVSAGAILFISYLLIKNAYNYVGLSLLLGGALGNLIDRMLYGKVVDFIDFSLGEFHWPAFNVADSSLTIGIAVVFLNLILRSKKHLII